MKDIDLLEPALEVTSLADALIAGVPIPEKAATDAIHIAFAAVYKVEYLLSVELRSHCQCDAVTQNREVVPGSRLSNASHLHAGNVSVRREGQCLRTI